MIQLLPIVSTIGTALRLPALVAFISQIATTLFGWFFIAKARNVTINLVILTLLIGWRFTLLRQAWGGTNYQNWIGTLGRIRHSENVFKSTLLKMKKQIQDGSHPEKILEKKDANWKPTV
ncbi:TPA: hypothetical protein NG611_003752 [Vibrio parahaemolyticus]|nr:hypothetical protein [Vibrio parahaemolyticus]HCE3433064.1 hypothetical protein [Vibrio parahaemolyticus]HCG7277517.1 hypothetical protein [Vibrio parahaemolyticus]HCM0733344.1 hypothetical protein [Vibrio parahaemolyticus]